MLRRIMVLLWVAGVFPAALRAQNYSISVRDVDGYSTYHLLDSARKMDVGVIPGLGNFVYTFQANGKNVLVPTESLADYVKTHWFCCGIPFLSPWADRIDQDYYYFEGKKYQFNDSLGNLLRVPPTNFIIHGLLVFDPHWKVMSVGASDTEGAYLTTRLDFYKYPELMAQFPFAQVFEVTYRLKDGKLENTTRVINKSASDIPIDYGYHPFLQPDGAREDWQVSINAADHWKVDDHTRLLPTGSTEPADSYLPHLTDFRLAKTFIDDSFSGLTRDDQGRGHFWVQGKTEKIEVVFGKNYPFGHVYAPPGKNLICFEPETGPTNAFNLNHAGKFPGLIVVKPGETFKAHFWIVPTGF
jgi:aldose 1-epimerase